ncbi:MAG: methyltransferase domain-containing protein [Chloroflexaceae bacterium]|nr:methyltransferase domain-containing protein [Chloroflexaceae bacterium]
MWGDSIHFGYWPDPTDDNISIAEAQQLFTDLLISHLKLEPGQRLLDVGCGTGRPAVQIARKTGAHVTGITVSRSQVELATDYARTSGMGDRVHFERISAMEMPYADATFDAAMAFESIFHMDRARVCEQMVRVVRPGGRVVIADGVLYSPMTDEQREIIYRGFEVTELAYVEDYIRDMKAAGLTGITCLDVTLNTMMPTIDRSLALLRSGACHDRLREAYTDEEIAMFLEGWEATRQINRQSFAYAVLVGEKPL